jgi:hypothetical protein
VKDRQNTFMLFIDLRKAYDTVDRDVLATKLLMEKAIPLDLTILITKFIKLSNVNINGKNIRTTCGV